MRYWDFKVEQAKIRRRHIAVREEWSTYYPMFTLKGLGRVRLLSWAVF